MDKNKRGISPVVAVAMLIAVVIVLALIVFFAAREMIEDVLVKSVAGEDMERGQACREINLDVGYYSSDGRVEIVNDGNIPVYKFDILAEVDGYEQSYFSDEEFDSESLGIGDSITVTIDEDYDEVEVIPIIIGEDEEGVEMSAKCEDHTHKARRN